ncbi:MAG: hypothetical protein ACI9LO_001990 [Planctomycetota bacterium]|jgi:uncharacterized protein YndB with AHSA1/START domain
MDQSEVDNNPVEGGRFTIVMKVGDNSIPHSGSYHCIDRPNKLGFSWESPFSTEGSEVRLLFVARDSDTTEVELTHVKFADEESRANHEGGWGNILDKLGEVA